MKSSLLNLSLAIGSTLLATQAHSAAILAESWNADSEAIGTGVGGDGWNGTGQHAGFGSMGAVPFSAISTLGAAQTGCAQVWDPGSGANEWGQITAWNGFDVNGVTDVDRNDFSFELIISPDTLSGGMQYILESGGTGDGMGLTLIDNMLVLGVNSGNAAPVDDQTLSVDLSSLYSPTNPNFDDFLNIRFSFQPSATAGSISLSAHNLGNQATVAGSAPWLDTDWDGGDAGGIGYFTGGRGGDRSNQLTNLGTGVAADWTHFDGQIAKLNTYTGILTAAPEPSRALLFGLGLSGLLLRRRKS